MYQRALQQNREKDNLYRNLSLLEYRAGDLLEARSYYNSLTDKNVMKNIDPKIIADLVGMGE
jgi:Tfp pilus assembly protein PilF